MYRSDICLCRKAEEGLQKVWKEETGDSLSLAANTTIMAYGTY